LPTRRHASRSSPGVSRGWLGLLVPLLVWPHFSSNTFITAGVAASGPPPSGCGQTDSGGRLVYLYSTPEWRFSNPCPSEDSGGLAHQKLFCCTVRCLQAMEDTTRLPHHRRPAGDFRRTPFHHRPPDASAIAAPPRHTGTAKKTTSSEAGRSRDAHRTVTAAALVECTNALSPSPACAVSSIAAPPIIRSCQ
jgi:hypothetical protein